MYAAVGTRTSLGQQVKLALVAALLTLSLAVGVAADTQQVEAKPRVRTICHIVEDAADWELVTGHAPDADWVGGMICTKI